MYASSHADFKTKKVPYSSLHSKWENNNQKEPNSKQKTIPKLRILFYLKMCDYRLKISGRQGAIQPSYNPISLDTYFRWIFNIVIIITLHKTFSDWVVYSTPNHHLICLQRAFRTYVARCIFGMGVFLNDWCLPNSIDSEENSPNRDYKQTISYFNMFLILWYTTCWNINHQWPVQFTFAHGEWLGFSMFLISPGIGITELL